MKPPTTGAPPQGNCQLSLYTDGWNAGVVAFLHVLQGVPVALAKSSPHEGDTRATSRSDHLMALYPPR